MASLLGEGSIGSLAGTYTAAAPATLADFRCLSQITSGADGIPANGYTVYNTDTSGTYFLWVRAPGLHNQTGTGLVIPPGGNATLQLTMNGNDIAYVQGWATTSGGATFSGNLLICGGVQIRRSGA